MDKSKLFRCRRVLWTSPEYTTNKDKDGSDHNPCFSTDAVNVHGEVSATPASCKSARNTAALVASNHFNAPPPKIRPVAAVSPVLHLTPLPFSIRSPSPGLLAVKPADEGVPKESCEDTQTSLVNMMPIGSRDEVHVYKNQLQQYAQKGNLAFPVYSSDAQGPPHACRSKSRVFIGGKSYETLEFSPTRKKAEQAAAKVACQALSVDVNREDGGFYESLLQEFAKKRVSSVHHTQQSAQAEMNAAKVAYCALTGEDMMDITEVQAWRRAERAKAKATGARGERGKAVAQDVSGRCGAPGGDTEGACLSDRDGTGGNRAPVSPSHQGHERHSPGRGEVLALPDPSAKRARVDSSVPAPRHPPRSLVVNGVNRSAGVESYWDEEDFGLGWRKCRSLVSSYDTSRFESKSDRNLLESVANDCARTMTVAAYFEGQLQSRREKLARVLEKIKSLKVENARQKELLQQREEECHKYIAELEYERMFGEYFLHSESGRQHMADVIKSAIEDFKKSDDCKELVMHRSLNVYDQAVKECQRLLRESGRVSEDILQLVDPQDSEHEDVDGVVGEAEQMDVAEGGEGHDAFG